MRVNTVKGTRDYIDIYFSDGRIVRAYGEMVVGGFVAEKDSMTQWKEPDGEPVTEEQRQEIVDAVNEKNKDFKIDIMFE